MVDLNRRLLRVREFEELAGFETAQGNANELDGADSLAGHLPRVESHTLTPVDVTLESHEPAQHHVTLTRVGLLDKHRRGQLAQGRGSNSL